MALTLEMFMTYLLNVVGFARIPAARYQMEFLANPTTVDGRTIPKINRLAFKQVPLG